MPLLLAFAPLLAAAAVFQQADPPITVTANRWAPFISPMGEPFRACSRSDDTLALWFTQADRNRDAVLTPDEMEADADRFFARLDGDRDGEIEPEELVAYEWELAPEVQLNRRWRKTAAQAASAPVERAKARQPDEPRRETELPGFDDALQGAARYALLNLPQPVAAADADFNRGITVAEFRNAARARFRLLDKAAARRLSLPQLQAMVPPPPSKGRTARRGKKQADKRIGLPLPPGN